MTSVTGQLNAEIQARVYRAQPKPWWMPMAIWRLLPRTVTHREENLGTIASTKDGSVTITR